MLFYKKNLHSQNYVPSIDGMRGIAILSVVFFHFFPNYVPGGFVGVDIFFVISGYLISNIIIKALNNGTFNYKEFFFPLDDILKWNTIYGSKGFLQYQFVISKKKVNKILRKIDQLNLRPVLVVLKVLGKENKNFLSFPKKGITFAMDFINTKENIKKLKVLNKQLLLDDGRVYLAKDSVINYKDFRKMYPNWTKIKKYKNKFFSSKQSKRLKFK